MKTPALPLFTTDFEAQDERRCRERMSGSLDRIRQAADALSFGLDPQSSPAQLDQIELALRCLRADLQILAD